MLKSKLFIFGIAAALTSASAISSDAATATTASTPKLSFFSYDTGSILWQPGARFDSPLDANKSRLVVTVLHQDGVEPYDYAGATPLGSGIENKLVGQVKNLSFDFLNADGEPYVHIGGGAPRYSADLDADGDGNYDFSVFMAASACSVALAEDTRWSRADFTGRTSAGCTLYVNGESFTSDGSKSAWRLMADAHPTWKVLSAYLVFDEDGTAFVDRLAFQNRLYVNGGSINCSSEASC